MWPDSPCLSLDISRQPSLFWRALSYSCPHRRQQTLSRAMSFAGWAYNRMRSDNGYRLYPIHLNTNERQKHDPRIPDKAFNFWQGIFLILVASFISIVAWIWAYRLLAHSDEHSQYFVAGHVMAGLACICSSLIALVATIARQIRNTYSRLEKRLWHRFVILMDLSV